MTEEELEAAWEGLAERLARPSREADFCEHSFLRVDYCAHCLGHVPDEEAIQALMP